MTVFWTTMMVVWTIAMLTWGVIASSGKHKTAVALGGFAAGIAFAAIIDSVYWLMGW